MHMRNKLSKCNDRARPLCKVCGYYTLPLPLSLTALSCFTLLTLKEIEIRLLKELAKWGFHFFFTLLIGLKNKQSQNLLLLSRPEINKNRCNHICKISRVIWNRKEYSLYIVSGLHCLFWTAQDVHCCCSVTSCVRSLDLYIRSTPAFPRLTISQSLLKLCVHWFQ